MKITNQEGSSFTESLITIVVAGVACVAFISVVASLVRETKNREVNEMMSSYALEGLSKMRLISSQGLDEDMEINANYTYIFDEDGVTLLSSLGTYDCIGEGSECELLDLSSEGDEFFYRKVELQLEGSAENGVAKVVIEVGRVSPTGVDHLDLYSIDGFVSVK